jgi:diguanylate cyclase (GGDEF)-like protein
VSSIAPPDFNPSTDEQIIFEQEYQRVCQRTDRLIALAMCLQWPAVVAAAYFISPRTGNGSAGSLHPHIIAAIGIGGLITVLPVLLAYLHPGRRSTRHAIAACQMLMSALIIHITGGRIESHFHVFGSLAFLAFYLDWQVIITATIVTLFDHALMGYYAPDLIFGSAIGSEWRLLEHVLWVVFCDAFLITSCIQSIRGLREAAHRDAQQKVLIHQAYHDALTGMGNRLLAHQELTSLLESPSSRVGFALLAIDLDRFKEVNDSFGHKVGDDLLIQVGERLRPLIRKKDTLVRMGGDEFVVILESCPDEAEAAAIAGRILESVNMPFYIGSHVVGVGASIGICLYPTGAADVSELFHHADLALYKVKERGRNDYFFFDEEMRAEVMRQLQFEDRVRLAVHDGLFSVHYQPIVNNEGTLIGFEALLRWTDAVLGIVPPNAFIPVAERCGLIIPLGQWVLEQSCHEAARWQSSVGGGVKISVNVSPVQLTSPDFVKLVTNTLASSGLRPELLDLELTESVLVEHGGRSAEAMQQLRALGVHLSIDDFGTGYSSLSYLRDLPVQRLKIDRSFVRDIVQSEAGRALIESMIEMGRTLKLRVLAEGVETAEQFEILRAAGCDEIQGFITSKAIPAAQAQTMVDHRKLLSSGQREAVKSPAGKEVVAA